MTMETPTPRWTWGSSALWIDETMNQVLAVSPRWVAARGSHSIYVWRLPDGELALRLPWRVHPLAPWLDDAQDLLCWYTPGGRVTELRLPGGELTERDAAPADPRWPEVQIDRSGGGLSVTWPSGHVSRWTYHGELVTRVACAPEVGLVAIPHGLRAVDVRDGRTGALRQTFRGPWEAALSRDGATVALGALTHSRISLGDVATGQVHDPHLPNHTIDALEYAPDGARLLVLAGGRGWLLDPAQGRPLARLRPCPSPRTLGVDAIDPVAYFSDDGAWVVGSAKHQLVRWSARTGEVDRLLELDPRSKIHALACDARGVRVAALGADYPGGLMLAPWDSARVWDLDAGREIARFAVDDLHDDTIELSPAGDRLRYGPNDALRVAELPPPDGPLPPARPAPEPLVPCYEDRALTITRGGAVLVQVPGAMSFASCPFARTFAVGHPDGRVELRAEDGAPGLVLRVPAAPASLAFAPDGRALAVGGRDGIVRAYAL